MNIVNECKWFNSWSHYNVVTSNVTWVVLPGLPNWLQPQTSQGAPCHPKLLWSDPSSPAPWCACFTKMGCLKWDQMSSNMKLRWIRYTFWSWTTGHSCPQRRKWKLLASHLVIHDWVRIVLVICDFKQLQLSPAAAACWQVITFILISHQPLLTDDATSFLLLSYRCRPWLVLVCSRLQRGKALQTKPQCLCPEGLRTVQDYVVGRNPTRSIHKPPRSPSYFQTYDDSWSSIWLYVQCPLNAVEDLIRSTWFKKHMTTLAITKWFRVFRVRGCYISYVQSKSNTKGLWFWGYFEHLKGQTSQVLWSRARQARKIGVSENLH